MCVSVKHVYTVPSLTLVTLNPSSCTTPAHGRLLNLRTTETSPGIYYNMLCLINVIGSNVINELANVIKTLKQLINIVCL